MRTLGIIPARGGSKRLPGKNLRLLGGRSLTARAIDCARGAHCLTRLVVSSDHPEVLELARAIDPGLPLARPPELATDASPAVDYVRHALGALADEAPFDAVVIVQPTSPFTTPLDIDGTVELLRSSGADSAVTVVAIEQLVHPFKLKRMDADRRLIPYLEDERGRMAAQDLPQVYVRNGSVYASRRAVIDAGQILGEDCRGYLMPRARSVDINDELDLCFAEFLLGQRDAMHAERRSDSD